MKYAFFVILEDNPNEQKVIDEISNQGVEATLIPSSSLKGKFFANNTEPSPMFGGLRTIIKGTMFARETVFFEGKLD